MAAVSGPCACTDTGLSGGTNTSTVGCGQWDLVSGSNRFTCFVVVSPQCGVWHAPPALPWLKPPRHHLSESTP